MESDNLKPADFLVQDDTHIAVSKLELGYLLESTYAYFNVHLRLLKHHDGTAKIHRDELQMVQMAEAASYDMLAQSAAILYASLPAEERALATRIFRDVLVNTPSALPPPPNIEDTFQ